MKTYKIFLKKSSDGVIEDLELIKTGFNVWAFIFQLLYLFYKRLWLQALAVALIFVLMSYLQFTFVNPYIVLSIQIGISLYVGFEASDWNGKKLAKDGYEFLGHTSGNDKKEAKLKYLESINNSYAKDDKLEQKVF